MRVQPLNVDLGLRGEPLPSDLRLTFLPMANTDRSLAITGKAFCYGFVMDFFFGSRIVTRPYTPVFFLEFLEFTFQFA